MEARLTKHDDYDRWLDGCDWFGGATSKEYSDWLKCPGEAFVWLGGYDDKVVEVEIRTEQLPEDGWIDVGHEDSERLHVFNGVSYCERLPSDDLPGYMFKTSVTTVTPETVGINIPLVDEDTGLMRHDAGASSIDDAFVYAMKVPCGACNDTKRVFGYLGTVLVPCYECCGR